MCTVRCTSAANRLCTCAVCCSSMCGHVCVCAGGRVCGCGRVKLGVDAFPVSPLLERAQPVPRSIFKVSFGCSSALVVYQKPALPEHVRESRRRIQK